MSAPILLRARGQEIAFPRRPLVMGIVNINDDSFSGDGTLDVDKALLQAQEMINAGADIIDAGAESARTNRGPITIDEEVNRLAPFIARFQDMVADCTPLKGCLSTPLLSLNTWRPEVTEQVLSMGGDILNDIGALPDDRNARLCAEHEAALLIMHSIGLPKVPHTDSTYEDVWEALEKFYKEKLTICLDAGLDEESIILDPGIDFAKQREDNLRIYRELDRLSQFERPVLLPVSRKTVIGDVLEVPDASERDAGTLGCLVSGLHRGAHIFRVHNVAAASNAVRLNEAIEAAQ